MPRAARELTRSGPAGRGLPLTAIGFTLATDIKQTAPEIDELRIKTGLTWGGQVGYFFSTHWGADALLTRQETALEVGTSAGRADLFNMKATKLHGNLVYQFGSSEARVRPFLFAGLGTTFFSAQDLQSETKLSSGIGGGLEVLPSFERGREAASARHAYVARRRHE